MAGVLATRKGIARNRLKIQKKLRLDIIRILPHELHGPGDLFKDEAHDRLAGIIFPKYIPCGPSIGSKIQAKWGPIQRSSETCGGCIKLLAQSGKPSFI